MFLLNYNIKLIRALCIKISSIFLVEFLLCLHTSAWILAFNSPSSPSNNTLKYSVDFSNSNSFSVQNIVITSMSTSPFSTE